MSAKTPMPNRDRGGKRADEPEAVPRAEHEVSRDDGPGDEERGFVEVVDRAALEREAALEHRVGVEQGAAEQEAVVDPVVFPEPAAQEKRWRTGN
jgi:hypothetical protein